MGMINKVKMEVNEDRRIVMYPDLYRAGRTGVRGVLRKVTKWFLGHSTDMSAPFYSPGRMDRNGR